MPKAKQKTVPRGRSQTQEDSGDDVPSTQNATQSFTQGERALNAIPSDEVERRVDELVQFLLIMDQKKLPTKRQDINKYVLKEHSKAFPQMMKKAEEKLSQVFGINLVEVASKQSQKQYILVNKFSSSHLKWPEEDNKRTGLLMVILSIIFMNNNIIQDSTLYSALRRIGLNIELPHADFGDLKKLITQEFVRQQFLEMTRQPTSDPATYEFRWGQRAKHELTKENCLDFVCKVYRMEDPSRWTAQWADVQRSERQTTSNGTIADDADES